MWPAYEVHEFEHNAKRAAFLVLHPPNPKMLRLSNPLPMI